MGTRRVESNLNERREGEGEAEREAEGEAEREAEGEAEGEGEGEGEEATTRGGNTEKKLQLAKLIADDYWKREENEHYKKMCLEWQTNGETRNTPRDPATVSLYDFASKYKRNWKPNKEVRIPHITPNFNPMYLPTKHGRTQRYKLFLKTILLSHKVGSKFDEVDALDFDQLEEECTNFCDSDQCPKIVAEEFAESQKEQEQERGDGELDNQRGEEEELQVEPDIPNERIVQDDVHLVMRPMLDEYDEPIDDDVDYDLADFAIEAGGYDWNEDARNLDITNPEDFRQLEGWLDEVKSSESISRELEAAGGEPAQLNDKQLTAYAIARQFIIQVCKSH